MVRIALDLRGSRHVALDQNSAGYAAESHRCRVKKRLAGDDLLRLADVRDDFLGGKLGAAGESGKRRGRSHHFQQFAPVECSAGIVGPVRELVLRMVPKFGSISKLIQAAPKPGSISLAC